MLLFCVIKMKIQKNKKSETEIWKMMKVISCLNNRWILYISDLMGCFVNQEEE